MFICQVKVEARDRIASEQLSPRYYLSTGAIFVTFPNVTLFVVRAEAVIATKLQSYKQTHAIFYRLLYRDILSFNSAD